MVKLSDSLLATVILLSSVHSWARVQPSVNCPLNLAAIAPFQGSLFDLSDSREIPNEITVPAVRKYLRSTALENLQSHAEMRDSISSKRNFFKRGSPFTVNDIPGVILGFLGAGDEGDVYLVRTLAGLATLKAFHESREMEKWLGDMDRLTFNRVSTPKILAEEKKSKLVLMQYIQGIDVSLIAERGLYYGLSERQIDSVLAKYKLWLSTPRGGSLVGKVGWQWNVVYDFQTDAFYIIDSN